MTQRLTIERDGTRLSVVDFGGSGDPVVLLHGLAGHAEEWSETASWLTSEHRVIAIDARGHGFSDRRPADVSRAAHVADAAYIVRQLDLAPVTLVGQSLGGHTALLVAAGHSELVSSLVVVEAGPDNGDAGELDEHVAAVERSLLSWPVPFETRADAIDFWGGPSVKAEAWASGLAAEGDGLRPRFDVDVMAKTLRDAMARSYWPEWEGLPMDVLVVRGVNGYMPRDEAITMTARTRNAELVDIEDAGHDVHLEQPAAWRSSLAMFLERR